MAVKICHDGKFEDTNSLDASLFNEDSNSPKATSRSPRPQVGLMTVLYVLGTLTTDFLKPEIWKKAQKMVSVSFTGKKQTENDLKLGEYPMLPVLGRQNLEYLM